MQRNWNKHGTAELQRTVFILTIRKKKVRTSFEHEKKIRSAGKASHNKVIFNERTRHLCAVLTSNLIFVDNVSSLI